MTTLSQALRRVTLNEQRRVNPKRHDGLLPTLSPAIIPSVLVHGGLNNSDLRDPRTAVLVQVVVQLDWGVGDRLDLYWNDLVVASETISRGDQELSQISFRVFPGDIPDGIAQVHYHLTGLVGGGERASHQHAPFLVKRTVPGNPDPDSSTPYINERLRPVTGIPSSMPADQGALVVGIPRYEHITADDLITVYWSGVPVTKQVSAAEASGGPLSLVISADIIRDNPGINLAVTYDIRDTVSNWSLFSVAQHIDVEGANALLAPAVRDADDNDVLDMDALGGRDVAIQVPVNGNLDVPSAGTLTWTGQPVVGPAVLFKLPFSITQAATRVTLYVPNSQAAALVGSTATVYYDGVKAGVPSRSRRVTVGLVGQPVELAVPRLTGVTGTTYNPDLITGSHQEVVVPAYGFMAVGQGVTLVWEGITASGGSVYQTWTRPIEQASQIGLPISFQVEKAYATALVGGSLRVSYRVASLGQEYPSDVLVLAVSGQVNTLPAPETDPHFPGGQVDPGQVGNTVNVVVRANTVLLPGDSITVHWHGRPDASINPTASFPSTGDLLVQIAKVPYVTGNANGAVDIWYDARRNGVIIGSSRFLTLTIGEAGQQPWPAPIVIDATGGQANPLSPIRPNTSNTANTATVVLTDSRLAVGDTVSVVWRYLDGTPAANLSGPVTISGTALVNVPSAVIATSLDSTVEVVCVVFRNGQSIGTSPALRLQVSGMPQSALPTPAITQAQGADLNVSNLNGDATATVVAWPLITLGQRYWLRAQGNLSDGSATTIELASDRPVTSLNGVSHVIPLARLQALRDGSDLTLEMRVAFDSPA
ncbi:hypothetical protein [Pseudomonas sp. RIT-To-2]|uniref:hypothetical protein n=1 Tax=Pseudomonas sp. RIT-To-2 TaxID=3462541 RepID=UPI0024133FCC